MKEAQKSIRQLNTGGIVPPVLGQNPHPELSALYEALKNIRFPDQTSSHKLEMPVLKLRLAVAGEFRRLTREAKKAIGGQE